MKSVIQSVSVCGLGKLGACIAATSADRGFRVVGIDVDAQKVEALNRGLPPVDEPLLAETITRAKSRLSASTDPAAAVDTDATFFIPPSPSLPDGSFSTEFLLRAMQSVAAAVKKAGKENHLFVCSSTTTPGAVDKILIPMLEKELGGKVGQDFGMIYNPEFIALGDVVRGLLNPDFVLVGESDSASGDRIEEFYTRYCQNRAPVRRMSNISAELCKISVNAYVTMKISFTNQLRLIAQGLGADPEVILNALGQDTRIGAKYLRPGLSYGGPCFPRDNRLLAWAAKQAGVRAYLAEATDSVNEAAKADLFERVKQATPAPGPVAILGMAYKPNTYITEESAGLHLAQQLKRGGYRVLAHDVHSNPTNSPVLHEFELLPDPNDGNSWKGVAAVVICCPWPQYANLPIPPTVRRVSAWSIPASGK